MPEVVCLGELLVDLCSTVPDVRLAEAPAFSRAPGGAPANVAVALRRLGVASGFVGAVGNDPFGHYLGDVLQHEGVDISHLAHIDNVRTSLAFVAVRSDGMQDFTFYRNPGADMFLSAEHIDPRYIRAAKALHHGSISLIDERPREATAKARALAREANLLISYDPNLRLALWPGREEAQRQIRQGFEGATVTKVSLEEWEFITGHAGLSQGAETLFDAGVELVVRSEGGRGASFISRKGTGHVPAFRVNPVEFTGAGDAFTACLLWRLLAPWGQGVRPGELDVPTLREIVREANAMGALTTTRHGAIPALPTANELAEFLRTAESAQEP